ncbi:hypothetical protein [Aeromicrobium terrae]|uniref:LppX_LprAFG lipoprotein n=1 Tax=Aeromicrobium terrae TaxID=2498846 RepID=A0A5C8NEZ5_9ACTN|nr:hypothetical protein [Aeromicrobium terrae]TXL58022.1 hypothetical protein FHP06_11905 [Aeromicrobium terrae]
MRSRLKHWTAVTTVVLVASVSLAACGDKDDDGTKGSGDSSSVGSSADTTLTKDNVFAELTKAQTKAGTSHIDMNVEVAGQAIKAKGDVKIGQSADDTAMGMTMDTGQAGAGTLEMRLVDKIFYLNFGPMTQNKFVKIDLTDKDNPIGKQYGDLLDNIDPSKQLDQIKGAVKSFEKKGAAKELDGVKAQPYAVVVDTSKVEAFKAAGADAAKLPKTLTYTMYVGPDNLLRRLISEIPNIAGAGATTLTIDYSKWGEDVSIEKPKASDISDKDPFAQLGQG